ncbi:MAG: hypothetical protein JSW50_09460, partial [Candidatus Latescibacterota bacterium]
RMLPKHSVDSVGFVFFRGNVDPSSRWSLLGAICETIVLNDPEVRATSPKVIRLPSLLTAEELQGISDSSTNRTGDRRLFEMVETEAVALVLNTTAIHKGRGIVLPNNTRTFGLDELPALAQRERGLPAIPAMDRKGDFVPMPRSLVYASESSKPSVIPGAVELVSPIYPASGTFLDIARDCATSAPGEACEGLLDAARQELSEGTTRDVSVSAE